jgi:hypothetical protein
MQYARRNALGFMASALLAVVAAPALAQVLIERPMPALRVEVIPPPPHPGWHWVPGHWAWRGNAWAWIGGHYVANAVPPMPAEIVEERPPPPGPRWFWVRGHYVWEGVGWAWHKGHWVRA